VKMKWYTAFNGCGSLYIYVLIILIYQKSLGKNFWYEEKYLAATDNPVHIWGISHVWNLGHYMHFSFPSAGKVFPMTSAVGYSKS
jgi:hypothetical protein